MGEYQYLCDIAAILLSTKLLGLATRKFQMPQVVGALLAGLILGPAMLGLVQETDFVKSSNWILFPKGGELSFNSSPVVHP